MKRELLKSRIIGILALLIIPMFLIQILPGIIYDCGMNILAASILSSFVTIAFSIFFSWKMVKEPVRLNIPKPIVICFFVVITLLFILVDQVLFIWINSHISDPGMEAISLFEEIFFMDNGSYYVVCYVRFDTYDNFSFDYCYFIRYCTRSHYGTDGLHLDYDCLSYCL